jgi:hypothetical protein
LASLLVSTICEFEHCSPVITKIQYQFINFSKPIRFFLPIGLYWFASDGRYDLHPNWFSQASYAQNPTISAGLKKLLS